jgi:hypothetical protein
MTDENENKESITNVFKDSNCDEVLSQSMMAYRNKMNEIFSDASKKTADLCKVAAPSFSVNLEPCEKISQIFTLSSIDLFNKLGQTITTQVDQIQKIFSEAAESFKKLDINLETYINRVNPILRNHFWFTTPSMDFHLWNYITINIDQQTDQKSFLDKTFVDYFSSNEFENLDYMISDWKHNSLLSERLNIIKECVLILKYSTSSESNSNNPHYLIIPTLIAQIDGLMTDYLVKKGYTFVGARCKRPTDDKFCSKYDNFDESFSEFLRSNYDKESSFEQFFKVEIGLTRLRYKIKYR